jgi:gamma-glutamyltranspeptidase
MSAHRGVVYCRKGGAAASQPLAVSAALSILQRGGSFTDADIACSAVLAKQHSIDNAAKSVAKGIYEH